MKDRTRRQRLIAMLRDHPATASELAARVETTVSMVLADIEHVSRSVDEDERVEAAPPECQNCGFAGFDDPVNLPSRCPECKSQEVTDPVFRIRDVE